MDGIEHPARLTVGVVGAGRGGAVQGAALPRAAHRVTRAYAGHSARNDAGTTLTYVRAEIPEVAAALAALTGEPHPLAAVTDRHRPRPWEANPDAQR